MLLVRAKALEAGHLGLSPSSTKCVILCKMFDLDMAQFAHLEMVGYPLDVLRGLNE